MPIAANALVTVADAKTALSGMAGSSNDPLLTNLINYASDLCEKYTERPLARQALTNVRVQGPRSLKLYPAAAPIDPTASISITFDKVAQTVWGQESDGDLDTFDVIVGSDDPYDVKNGLRNHFYRKASWLTALAWAWPDSRVPHYVHPFNVLLSYTGGFNPIPGDLQLACLHIVQMLFRDFTKGTTDLAAVNVPAGGTINFGPPPALPRRATMILDAYKRATASFAGAGGSPSSGLVA